MIFSNHNFQSLTQVLHKKMMNNFSLIIKGFKGRG